MKNEVLEIHQLMRELIVRSGVEEKIYESKIQNLNDENDMDIWLAYKKIVPAFKHAESIYGKMPTASWNLAQQLGGIESSHDVIALRERLKKLRSVYYESFKGVKCGKKKTKQNKSKNGAASGPVQPK